MRTFTSISAALFLAACCQAQNQVNEVFDDITTLAGSGWAMQNNSNPPGLSGWFQGNPNVFVSHSGATSSYIGANFDNTAGTGNISNWLLTPVVNLANGMNFEFWTRTTDFNPLNFYPDRMQVRLSTAGSSTNVGTTDTSVGDFTTLLLDINPAYQNDYPHVWTRFQITVSGLSGPTTGRFAFRYFVEGSGPTGLNGDYIGIDDVIVGPATGGSTIITQDSVALGPGILLSGTPADLNTSNDVYYTVRPGIVISSSQSPIVMVWTGHAPASTATTLTATVEARAQQANIRQTVEAFNYTTAVYEQLSQQVLPTTTPDTIVTTNITNPTQHIDAANGNQVRLRISYKAVGPILAYPWRIFMDQVIETYTP